MLYFEHLQHDNTFTTTKRRETAREPPEQRMRGTISTRIANGDEKFTRGQKEHSTLIKAQPVKCKERDKISFF
jgi:hypothetical protein